MPGPKSRMSIPAQKPRPAPVRTTACTARSAAKSPSVWANSACMASLMAFSRSGRFSRTVATPWCVRSCPKVPGMSNPLDDRRGTHAPARAHCHQSRCQIAALELIEDGADQHGTSGADRVAERDRPAVDVDEIGIDVQVTHRL